MLDDVIEHNRPLAIIELAVQPSGTELPRGNPVLQFRRIMAGNEAFALEQAAQAQQAKSASPNASPCQARRAADGVERFAFFGGFRFVKRTDMQGDNMIITEERRADRRDPDI